MKRIWINNKPHRANYKILWGAAGGHGNAESAASAGRMPLSGYRPTPPELIDMDK